MTVSKTLTQDHKTLDGARATRRYFAKFARIIGHLKTVVSLSETENAIDARDGAIILDYLDSLEHSFTALSYKFLMASRVGGQKAARLSIDKKDSGFPVFGELLQMAADALQADDQLDTLPDIETLKKEMVTHILSEQTAPTQLQFALAQRIYFETVGAKTLFLTQNHPKGVWKGSHKTKNSRGYLLFWAAYDSQSNVPAIYLMDIEDTGKKALPKDDRRWPLVKAHLNAQAVSGLKLVTIARGFDSDFKDLHPKRLRRFRLGPMYSHAFTEQAGPLRDVLAEASGVPGLDWALEWTVETLESEDSKWEKTGVFSQEKREVFKLDKASKEDGATHIHRALILPHRAYQVMREKNPPSLRQTRKYVVGKDEKILNYR